LVTPWSAPKPYVPWSLCPARVRPAGQPGSATRYGCSFYCLFNYFRFQDSKGYAQNVCRAGAPNVAGLSGRAPRRAGVTKRTLRRVRSYSSGSLTTCHGDRGLIRPPPRNRAGAGSWRNRIHRWSDWRACRHSGSRCADNQGDAAAERCQGHWSRPQRAASGVRSHSQLVR
jgi:hypothetical protein